MLRFFFRTLSLALVAGAVAATWFAWQLRSAIPNTSTEITATVVEPVAVERRTDGLTRIHAADRLDAVQALGLAHARDRFWTMDLARRRASGRLAELLGEEGLSSDRSTRPHGFAALSERTLAGLPEAQQALLRAYTEGVNAGLTSLEGAPWAYRLRGLTPEPWTEKDCILVLNTFFLELQGESWLREAMAGQVRERLPLEWVSPLVSGPGSLEVLPGPRVYSLPKLTETDEAGEPTSLKEEAQEAFTLAQPLANEAGLTVIGEKGLTGTWTSPAVTPGPWYPCQLRYRHGNEAIEVTGLTRPGSPLIWAGTNGQVAWTIEPADVDNADLVLLPHSDIDPDSYYIHGTTVKKIDSRDETILVRGEDPVTLPVLSSPWGPIITRGEKSQYLSLRWTAHESDTLDFSFADMELASQMDDATTIAAQAGLPPLKVHVQDGAGEARTVLATRVPLRNGFEGQVPVPWTYGDRGWKGWQPRSAPTPFEPTARAKDLTPFWWNELARIVGQNTPPQRKAEWESLRSRLLGNAADTPEGRALAQGYARRVEARALSPLLRRLTQKYPDFHYGYFAAEPLAKQMIEEKPAHLLDSRYVSWDDLLLNAADDFLSDVPRLLKAVDQPLLLSPEGSRGWIGTALMPWRQPRPIRQAFVTGIETGFAVQAADSSGLAWSLPAGPNDHPWAFDATSYQSAWENGVWSQPSAEKEAVAIRLILRP